MSSNYLQPTWEAGRDLMMRRLQGPVLMLNLLRFRAVADYSGAPEYAPPLPITGADAFDLYVRHTLPHLRSSGGDIVLLGQGAGWFIGPSEERWDLAMLVRQSSVEAFLAFARDTAYLEGMVHRDAAVEDSRLLPLQELPLPSHP